MSPIRNMPHTMRMVNPRQNPSPKTQDPTTDKIYKVKAEALTGSDVPTASTITVSYPGNAEDMEKEFIAYLHEEDKQPVGGLNVLDPESESFIETSSTDKKSKRHYEYVSKNKFRRTD